MSETLIISSSGFCRELSGDRGIWDGWSKGHSVFTWADKGEWSCRVNEEDDFYGRKFRIGFEPLFVDFTGEGVVYVVFLVFKWFTLGIIAGQP